MPAITTMVSNVTFWIGLVSVVLFAYSRFNVSLPDTDELSPPLSPRTFTTNFRFRLAAFVYVGIYVFFYFLLIIAGSIPSLSDQLIKAFGSVKDVSSPAGAALIATSMLPSTPGFTRFDAWLRAKLQEYASIPAKAWIIGQEILQTLDAQPEDALASTASLAEVRGAIASHAKIFDDLTSLWDRLVQVEQFLPARRYGRFFGDYKKVADKLRESFSIKPNQLANVESARYVESRLRTALCRAARFTGCAMLNAESSEAALRSRLNEKGIEVPEAAFNFGPAHLLIATCMIAVVTVCGVFFGVGLYAAVAHQDAALILRDHYLLFVSWGIVADVTYTLPLILAAGTEMYLLDRDWQDAQINGIDRAAGALLNFLGAAGLAFISMLAYSYLMSMIPGAPPADPFRILPWVLPAATVSTIFLMRAAQPANPGWVTAIVDGTLHALGGAAATGLSIMLFYLADYHFLNVPDALMNVVSPISAAAISFSIGAVLCYTARRRVSVRAAAGALQFRFMTPR